MTIITESFPEIQPENIKFELPYWRDLLSEFDPNLLQFPLLKNKPTTGN